MSSSVTQLPSSATRFAGVVSSSRRSMGTSLIEVDDAGDTFKKSCYFEMDFTISEDAMVYEAVQRFAAFDVGAFVTLDANGMYRETAAATFLCRLIVYLISPFVLFDILFLCIRKSR